MPRPSPFAALVVPILLGACASAGDPFSGREAAREIEIEVLNLNFSDATLHAVRIGQRIRLGTVTGKQSSTFTLDWPASLPLRIEIRLLGGQRCTTGELTVDPGDRLYLEIPVEIRGSPLCSGPPQGRP